MSDEESFVILGSCSLRSNETESLRSGFASLEQSKIEMDQVESGTANLSLNDKLKMNETPNDELKTQKLNSLEKSSETLTTSVNKSVGYTNVNEMNGKMEKSNEMIENILLKKDLQQNSGDSQQNQKINISASTGSSSASVKNDGGGSLAASFILGEVKADVLKSSVYSQFPSLCSVESCAEDINKLQNFMSEYLELKSTLATVNSTMRQFYYKTQQWRDDMQKTEREYKKQLQNCNHDIAKLRNENLNLKGDMQLQREQFHIFEEYQLQETEKLRQVISEKTSLIDTLRTQIDKIEAQQLASFDYISKHENDTKDHPDYIARSEHLLAIKELERKMSAIVAENYELQDMKKIFLDEITTLKVNLVSAEELMSKARQDIDFLKSKDIEKSQLFESYEKEREQMREEIDVLKQQVEVYCKDFQLERDARESLAGEKEQLVQDLRALQRSNQQLIEEQQRRLESVRATATATAGAVAQATTSSNSATPTECLRQSTPTAAARKPPPLSRFNCPVCSKGFDSLIVLQTHVNMCLDRA